MLKIALLGRFDLQLNGEAVDLTSRPQKKLLAYLALNAGQTIPRVKLAGILWLDSSESTARKNLRHHLWRLRQAIGDEYLLTTKNAVAFNGAGDYSLDVELLEKGSATADSAQLIEAVSLYRGELLPGFYDDWLQLERERVQTIFERRMQTLLDQLTAEARWPDLITWAEHWLAQAHAPEPAYRALMTGCAGLGDLSGVAKNYQRCQKALQEELGVEPSAETQLLFERLTSGEPLEEIETIRAARRAGRSDSVLPEGTVTFLFTDIQGSTELLHTLGDKYVNLLADHHRILREIFARRNGREVGSEGDSFFVSFPRAADAVAAAAEAQRALAVHDWPDGADVRVRMGLHTGEPWTIEENYAGIDVHRAARIANTGHGGQVLLSETTTALILDQLPDGVTLLDLGWHHLKDMKRAEHIRQLVIEGLPSEFPALKSLGVVQPARVATGAPDRLPAFLAEDQPEPERPLFVGRQAELARLDRYLEAALAGQGQVAFLAGDAGSGKTSMMSAFAARAGDSHPDLLVLWGTCNAFGGSGDPFLPFRKALTMLTGDIEEALASGAITTGQARLLWQLMPVTTKTMLDYSPDLPDTFIPAAPLIDRLESAFPSGQPVLNQLQARTAQQSPAALGERPQLYEQVVALLRRLAERQPLILLLDDLQWADRGSIELLFHLGRSLSGARLLLLGAYRLDEVTAARDHPLSPVLSELRRSFGDVWLDLNQSPGRAFIDAYIDGEANHLGEAFRESFFQRTAGHPLFTVELLRDMQERGDLVKDDSGAWTATPALDWDVLPARVEGAVESRIGRLATDLRDILTVAAVEGEGFTAQVIGQVQEVGERPLLRLLSRELDERYKLVQEDRSQWAGRQVISHYRFAHQMFQRFLYNDLSEAERRLLHGQVGQALETLYEDKSDELIVQLAHHFDEAGDGEKAASYLLAAGDRARAIYANEEAIDYYQRTLEHVQRLGDAERLARTLMRLGLTYHNDFDYQRSRQAYDQGFAAWQRVEVATPIHQAGATLRTWLVKPLTLDPSFLDDSDSAFWIQQLFSGLVSVNDQLVVVPDVARRWQIHDGGLTYVFHLREDAKWSDGHPLTAADFILAWRRKLDPEVEDLLAEHLFIIRGARAFHQGQLVGENQLGLHAPDDYTLIVELEQPASYFLRFCAGESARPVPQHRFAEVGDDWAKPGLIVTNGPYKIANWSAHETAKLTRNPCYHGFYGGNVDHVEALVTDRIDDWEEAMFRCAQGDVDVLDASELPGDAFAIARARHGENYLNVPRWGTAGIGINPNHFPVNDIRLRQALVMVIDRDQLIQDLAWDHLTPAHGGWISHGLPGHSPDIGLPYEPEVARHLFAKAGYPDGKGFPELELVLLSNPLNRELGSYLALIWQEELGVTVRPAYLPLHEFGTRLRSNLPAIHSMGWWAEHSDPENFFWVVSREQINEEAQDSLSAAGKTTDQQRRLALYRQVDRLLIKDALVIPLTYFLGHYFMSSRVRKFPATMLWQDIIVDAD